MDDTERVIRPRRLRDLEVGTFLIPPDRPRGGDFRVPENSPRADALLQACSRRSRQRTKGHVACRASRADDAPPTGKSAFRPTPRDRRDRRPRERAVLTRVQRRLVRTRTAASAPRRDRSLDRHAVPDRQLPAATIASSWTRYVRFARAATRMHSVQARFRGPDEPRSPAGFRLQALRRAAPIDSRPRQGP